MTARSRQAPESHSVPVAHRSLGPLLTAALQATTIKKATRITLKIFMRRISPQTAPRQWKSSSLASRLMRLTWYPSAMENLRITLTDMANTFARQLLGVVREATVRDVRETLGAPRGHARQSASQGAEPVVALLETRRAGMRAAEIRASLGIGQSELARLVGEGLRSKKLVKTGVRRGTIYFAR